MKYTDKRNNITFGNVSKAGSHLASGPLGLNGKYRDSGGTIDNINEDLIIYNAIDINWNGAQVGDGVTLNTTGDLLSWIKTISNKTLSGTTISISDDGFWIINGVKTNMKVTGKDGLTPRIGPAPNYNWFIGDTDTGISAKGNVIKEELQNLIQYIPTIKKSDQNSYKIGTVKINDKSTDIYGIKGNIETSYITNLISNNVTYSSNVAESDTDSYIIGNLKVQDKNYTIRGRKYYGDGKGNSTIPNVSFQSKVDGTQENTYPIADLTINGEKYSFFGKYFSGGGVESGGSTFVENTFDPTSIWNSISELNSYISDLENRLSEIHNENQESINNDLKRILEEWKKFKDANGIVDGTGWHWATDENSGIRTYLSQYGQFDGNGTGTWSTLEQRVNELEGRVNGIKQTVDDNGNITLDISESMVKQYVRETLTGEFIAGALMESKYILAKSDDYSSNSDINVLKWLLSQFKSESGRYGTLAQMLCDSSQGPMSEVLTRINTIDGRVSSVETSMSALFGENISGAVAKSDWEEAFASLFANDNQATSNIITKVTQSKALANVVAAGVKNNIEAGVSAVLYETNSNGNILYFDENGYPATKQTGTPRIKNSASIIASINKDGDSFATIKADKIDIDGIITSLQADTAFINNLVSSDAFINTLRTKDFGTANSLFVGEEGEQGCMIKPLSSRGEMRFGTVSILGNDLWIEDKNTFMKLNTVTNSTNGYRTGEILVFKDYAYNQPNPFGGHLKINGDSIEFIDGRSIIGNVKSSWTNNHFKITGVDSTNNTYILMNVSDIDNPVIMIQNTYGDYTKIECGKISFKKNGVTQSIGITN